MDDANIAMAATITDLRFALWAQDINHMKLYRSLEFENAASDQQFRELDPREHAGGFPLVSATPSFLSFSRHSRHE
jgi:hypothetical protein